MYNPNITGYSDNEGPFLISLNDAKGLYGVLPSSYNLLSPLEERSQNKVLNLELGINVTRWLTEDKRRDLKPFVVDYFSSWHRDYDREFGISVKPLRNLNEISRVKEVLRRNEAVLRQIEELDLRKTLLEHQVFKQDTMNSIAQENIVAKSIEAINRKESSGSRSQALRTLLSHLKVREILDRIDLFDKSSFPLDRYADEIAKALGEITRHLDLPGSGSLRFVSGRDVEFTYAPRDLSYLHLGRKFGDCTSDKKYLQTNCETENIYWTVFSWIMDSNYQILVALVDGKPVIKCHILPLFVDVMQTGRELYPFLFIDAIETIPQYRFEETRQDPDYRELEHAFRSLVGEVHALADRMGIAHIYSERFSNTAWVRKELQKLPEIYLDTKRIVKIDELEDVFGCASSFCSQNTLSRPEAIFMELQARNTYLISENIIGSNKSFGVLRGDPADGLPAKFAFSV